MKSIALSILIVLIFGFQSCFVENNDPQLPAITMEGKNTFGCLINGKVWIPKGSYNIPPVTADASSSLFIQWRAGTGSYGFAFYLASPIQLNQVYNLRDTAIVRAYFGFNINSIYCGYEPFQVNKGSMTITRWDRKNSVFSGTFNFNTFNPLCGSDTVRVTEGRFDIGDITL